MEREEGLVGARAVEPREAGDLVAALDGEEGGGEVHQGVRDEMARGGFDGLCGEGDGCF